MNAIPENPLYLVPSVHPLVPKWHPWFEQIRINQSAHLRFVISHYELMNSICVECQEMFIALQHNPDLLDNLIFSLHFAFEKANNTKERYTGHEWKNEHGIKWFVQLANAFPAAIFFINDNDARFYTLLGDLILQKEIITAPLKNQKARTFLDNIQMSILSQRLFNNACFFLLYCHGSGFNPEKYIDSLIADYGLQFTYNDVKEIYLEKTRNGEPFTATRKPI